MSKKVIIPLLILLLFIIGPWQGQAAITDAGNYLKSHVVTRTLKNGITVILLNRGYAPVLAFETSFRVGSVDESYRTIGAAHMLEHMLFKGTDKLGTRDFKKEKPVLDKIEAVGETIDRLKRKNPENIRIPDLQRELKNLQKEHQKYIVSTPYDKIYTENGAVGFNASTSRDKTGYYVELPASKLELWARLESERLRHPVLREYYLERDNVLQERLMRYDSKGSGLLFEQFMAEAFLAHPYRHPTIGWRSIIPNLSLAEIRRFYWKHYTPSRMTITIIGKQDVEKTFRVIKKFFSMIKPRPEPRDITITEPPQRGERRFTLNFRAKPELIIGWHKPTYPSTDDYAFDVLSELLTGGRSSWLYRTLVLEKKIASSVSSWNGGPGARCNNLFVIFANPRAPHTAEELEKAIYSEMERFFKKLSTEDFKRVINTIESDMVFSLARNKGLARLLSYYQTVFGDWRYAVYYTRKIKGVTLRDIQKIRRYLIPQNRTVGILKEITRKENKKK